MQTWRAARGVWLAWAAVLTGGLLVLAATAVVLTQPCADGGRATLPGACEGSSATAVVTALVVSGTVLAVTGGVCAAALLLRRVAGGRTEARRSV